MILLLYFLAVAALIVGAGALYLTLVPAVPSTWVYYHYRVRKPAVWSMFAAGVLIVGWVTLREGAFPLATLVPLLLLGLAVVFTYRLHQEVVFRAVDFPAMAEDPLRLPLRDDMHLAVIESEGVSKAYPLDYVIHHHIVNDRFGDKTVALTFCAMCRSIIPFDVTDIGPLFVGSFKKANMIVADRRTKTFFQQATFESIVGPLHPHTLSMVPFQILSWADVKHLDPLPQVVRVTEKDLRPFELPIHGVWRRIVGSEVTPGLRRTDRDESLPARTRVVGVLAPVVHPRPVYLKDDLLEHRVVRNDVLGCYLVAVNGTVNGFHAQADGHEVALTLTDDLLLHDSATETDWDLRGHRIRGQLDTDLTPVAISDEYWFSWKFFHPDTELARI
ncbi:DUF3179 domain-containing protein [Mycobacterium sp. Y57]|uniref:DUF3179 domain-containing (seleno)protein n=1 Tax=Mycolicibacterium xanthum TaxID=2796469 RepID=UPI001C84A64C|nr:DUF3179 domain-containing (seleno)protein [Mycolicibacterium xanthum]MBX7433935.1 DUF3179 domain-containing protein [Mycolicibacterium xanthum]